MNASEEVAHVVFLLTEEMDYTAQNIYRFIHQD